MLDVREHRISLEKIPDYVQDPPLLGGLFYRGHINIVASKPGMGKTWLMLAVSRRVVREGLKVVIFNGEGGLPLLVNRCAAIGFRPADDYAVIYDSSTADFSLSTKDGWDNFCHCCYEEEPDVVYVDSLLAFLGEDESNMKEMNAAMTRLRSLASKFDCAVVVNHHLRKSSRENLGVDVTLDDVIGSSVLSRIACTVYCLVKQPGGINCKVTCLKSWFAPTADNFLGIKVKKEGGIDLSLTSLQSQDLSTRGRVILFMKNNAGKWITTQEIAFGTRQNQRTLRRVMKNLYDAEVVERMQTSSQPITYSYRLK